MPDQADRLPRLSNKMPISIPNYEARVTWSGKAAPAPLLDELVEVVRTPNSPLDINKDHFPWLRDKTQVRLDSLLSDSVNRRSISPPILRDRWQLLRQPRLPTCHPRR